MGKADLHIHTIYSWDGTCTVEAVLKQAAHIAELDVIAITDHDDIRDTLEAVEWRHAMGLRSFPVPRFPPQMVICLLCSSQKNSGWTLSSRDYFKVPRIRRFVHRASPGSKVFARNASADG